MRADRAMGAERGGGGGGHRIDLGAPLRSARGGDAPPRCRADLNSGPLRHPGTVPFVWELRPGQPKSVRTRRAAPPTPPREASRPEEVLGGGTPYHDALADLDLQAFRGGADRGSRPAAAPRKVAAAVAVEEASAAAAGKREAVTVAAVLRRQDGCGEEEEEEEERFSDAVDSLSRSESFAMNCSVSGISGAPDPGQGAEPCAPGFMMDRFLPAAQAVAVGSPQYTFRKAAGAAGGTGNSGRDHARAAAAKASAGSGDDRMRRTPVQLPYQHLPPNYLSCAYPRREDHEEEDDEEDDDDFDVHSTRGFSAKGCGLLPGLCVKTSLLLLNPMPAMKRGKAQRRGRGRQFPSKGRGQMAQSPLARSSQNKHLGCDSNGQSWEDVYKHKLEQKYLGQLPGAGRAQAVGDFLGAEWPGGPDFRARSLKRRFAARDLPWAPFRSIEEEEEQIKQQEEEIRGVNKGGEGMMLEGKSYLVSRSLPSSCEAETEWAYLASEVLSGKRPAPEDVEVEGLHEAEGGGKRSKPPSPQPHTPEITEGHGSSHHASGGKEQQDTGSNPIHSIGRDLTINCLLRLSRSDYGSVASLSRDFRSLVRTGEIYRLRRQSGVAEHWVYFSCNVLEWDAYDPYRDRWIRVPKMPPDECFMCSDKESLAVGTELLVFGMARIVFRYSILTNSWSRADPMNYPRCLFGSTSVGEKAFVAGGTDSLGNILSSAEMYDSLNHTWTLLPSMNRARKMCSGVFMDGKFYVIGGVADNNKVLTCGEEYDLKRRSWRIIENMSEGLKGVTGAPPLIAVVNNELYAADYSEKDLKKYDKKNNKWITLGKLPERSVSMNGWGLAFRACGDRLIVIGGPRTYTGGTIELNSWIPNDRPPVWDLIARRPSGNFVYNCAVMSC